MFVRIAAGLVGLAIVLPILIWGGGPGVEVVCWAAMFVGVYEFAKMALPDHGWKATGVIGLGAAAYMAVALHVGVAWLGLAAGLSIIYAFLVVMAWSSDTRKAAQEVALLVLGILYPAALLCWLPMLRDLNHGLGLIFLLLAATWLGDTGAYFTGRTIGKHRMSPMLSPKKTWEGTFGGIVWSVVGAVVVGQIAFPEVDIWRVAVAGVLVDVAGILGDLAESLLKRTFGVKDSGRIMPGHGGILDRIDSLLFSTPVLYLVVLVLFP